MAQQNAFYAQSGGVTAVLNARRFRVERDPVRSNVSGSKELED